MLTLLSAIAVAAPTQVLHQGRLLNADGSPIDGPATVTFQVYDVATDGTPLHTEVEELTLQDGYYTAPLGPFPSPVLAANNLWVQVTVGSTTLAPRSPIFASFHALGSSSGGSGDLPSYSESARNGLTPTAGKMIWNTSTSQVNVWTGTQWVALSGTPTGQLVLLLHLDGADGSTTIVDQAGHSISAAGAAAIRTAQSRFGGASAHLSNPPPATSNFLGPVPGADFNFGTGDFTLEGWIYPLTLGNAAIFASQNYHTPGFNGNWLYRLSDSNQTAWASYDGQGAEEYSEFSSSITTNTWHHVAVTRQNGTLRIFENGVLRGSRTSAKSLVDGANGVRIGRSNSNQNFNGYIDEVRFTKGVALYTANFTPPTAPFPNP